MSLSSRSKRKAPEDVSTSSKKVAVEDVKGIDGDSKQLVTLTAYVEAENKNIEKLSFEEGITKFNGSCDALSSIMKKICEVKTKNPKNIESELEKLKLEGIKHFQSLRYLNRYLQFKVKNLRDITSSSKQAVEQKHLKLQNQYYEICHFKKQIQICKEYRSTADDIELVSEDDFYSNAPKSISNPKMTKNDDHLRMKARLDWELRERQILESRLDSLNTRRDFLTKSNEEIKEKLASLQPKLQSILDVCRPVQQCFGLKITENQQLDEVATHLPLPLHTLFVKFTAFAHVYPSAAIDCTIEGDAKLASQFNDKVEFGDNNAATSNSSTSKRRSLESVSHDKASKEDDTVQQHPLTVKVTVKVPLNNEDQPLNFNLAFSHFHQIDLVLLKCSFDLATVKKLIAPSAIHVMNPDTMLHSIFPLTPDRQLSSSPSLFEELPTASIFAAKMANLPDGMGAAFHWVQKLALTRMDPSSKPNTDVHKDAVDELRLLFDSIVSRISQRWSLSVAMKSLDARILPPVPIVKSIPNLNVSKTHTAVSLLSFSKSSKEDFFRHPASVWIENLLSPSSLLSNCFFFQFKLDKSFCVLRCDLAIPYTYPAHNAVFLLSLVTGGPASSTPVESNASDHPSSTVFTSQNNEVLQQLEYQVNVESLLPLTELPSKLPAVETTTSRKPTPAHAFDIPSEYPLLCQLHTLLSGFDVAISVLGFGSVAPTKDKTVLKCTKGPDRSLPLRFVSQLNAFIHS